MRKYFRIKRIQHFHLSVLSLSRDLKKKRITNGKPRLECSHSMKIIEFKTVVITIRNGLFYPREHIYGWGGGGGKVQFSNRMIALWCNFSVISHPFCLRCVFFFFFEKKVTISKSMKMNFPRKNNEETRVYVWVDSQNLSSVSFKESFGKNSTSMVDYGNFLYS